MLIGNKYKLESDSLNITLYKKEKPRKGGTRWRTIGYFSSPKSALKYLANLEVMDTGMKDLETVVEKLDEFYSLVDQLKHSPEMLQLVLRSIKG